MKKKLSIILATGLSLVLSSTVFAAMNLTDLDKSYAKAEIQTLVNEGIVNGYEDQTFRPEEKINREEFAKLLCKALKLSEDAESSNQFKDVSDWARPYVGALYKAGITRGTGADTFGALDNLSREDMATFFVRAMNMQDQADALYSVGAIDPTFNDAANISDYAKPYVGFAQKIGFIQGDGTNFDPANNSERQDVAHLVYTYIKEFDSKYIPNIIKVELPAAVDVTVNADGMYKVTLPTTEGLNSTEMTFNKDEVINNGCFYYGSYINYLSMGIINEAWGQLSNDTKLHLAQTMILSWSLSGFPELVNPEINSQEAFDNATLGLIAAIDKAFANDGNNTLILDETTMISIGFDSQVLVKH